MELTDKEAKKVKRIYDNYYNGIWTAEEVVSQLEMLINGEFDLD